MFTFRQVMLKPTVVMWKFDEVDKFSKITSSQPSKIINCPDKFVEICRTQMHASWDLPFAWPARPTQAHTNFNGAAQLCHLLPRSSRTVRLRSNRRGWWYIQYHFQHPCSSLSLLQPWAMRDASTAIMDVLLSDGDTISWLLELDRMRTFWYQIWSLQTKSRHAFNSILAKYKVHRLTLPLVLFHRGKKISQEMLGNLHSNSWTQTKHVP